MRDSVRGQAQDGSACGRHFIGVDLGGTKIATALVSSDLDVVDKVVVPTNPEEGVDAVVGRIIRSVEDLASRLPSGLEDVAAIGVGSPGPLDGEAGIVIDAPNLGWSNVPVTEMVQKATGRRVFLENDANVAAIAENKMGAGKGTRNMAYVTVSTGIGSGLILNGRLFTGATGAAGELGHVTVLQEGPMCNCGNRGCLEALASGTAIAKRGREVAMRPAGKGILRAAKGEISSIDSSTVAMAAASGDPVADAIMKTAFEYLGTAIANVLNLLDLEMVVIGGGVSQVGDILFDTVRSVVSLRAFPFQAEKVKIVPASLGGDAGSLGAACFAMEKASLQSDI